MKELILVLLTAIRAVESANGLDTRAKGNDLQITPICVLDVNCIYGTSQMEGCERSRLLVEG